MPPVRVAYIDHASEVGGGAEEALADLLRFVDRDRVQPILLVAQRTDWLRDVDLSGIDVHRLFATAPAVLQRSRDTLGHLGADLQSARASLGPVWQLASAVRRTRADIVHTNSLKTHVLGGIAAWLSRTPLVWDVRDILDPGPARQLLQRVAKLTRPHIIAMSGAVAEYLSPTGRPVTVIHGGRSPDHFPCCNPSPELRAKLGLSPEDEVCAVVARLTPWKGHMVLLDAFAAVHRERPRARLLVVGAPTFWESTYEQELRDRADRLGIGEATVFTGFRADIPQLLAVSDIMVLPSRQEPFGIVIVEAMLAGKPVVVCDTGGPPEIVVHGETGLVVPTWQVGPLADAVCALLGDPQTAQRMGRAGRLRALEHFDVRQAVRKVEAVYDQVLAARRR
ncbi:MAG: glycosyltransferase family 4 protein [Armatimonadetes bacterium]|nr:glycosyltransferase family 4 protein [Armatimonadota bacterium]